jgi:GntR family transcriptional regulator, transcriptional repressor for pyruvate dehydrogenase complex
MKMQFEKIKKKPAYRILAESMIERILDGRLKEGDQLPTEAQLCEMFGVNRSTVREGIRALEEANLLRRESAKRLLVSRPSNEDVGDQLERALILREVTFDELWEAMYIIEPAMARLAASKSDRDLLDSLDENLQRSETALAHGDSLISLDIEFHNLVATLCGNRALILGREPLSRLFYPTFKVVMDNAPEAGARLVGAHRFVLEAIHKRDAIAADEWMRKHIRDFKRGYQMTQRDVAAPIS